MTDLSKQLVSGPRVYILSRPSLDDAEIERFLSDEGAQWRRSKGASPSEEIVELGGRVCYMSFGAAQSPQNNTDYIHNLIQMGHESVLEHATWTFFITGVSRAFSHQLVRHRAGFSFSQLSQQYHDESEARFVIPESLRLSPRAAEIWSDTVEQAKSAYKAILEEVSETSVDGVAEKEHKRAIRSAARSVLPNATETKMVVTSNARALRYFLRVRGGIVGDLEMRRVCGLLLNLMRKEAASLFADFELITLEDGTPLVRVHS
jgi:thymidylate synthase (FAD)